MGMDELEDIESQGAPATPEALKSIVARHRQPLHFVFVGAGLEPEQLRHAAVEIAQRIREVLLLIDFSLEGDEVTRKDTQRDRKAAVGQVL